MTFMPALPSSAARIPPAAPTPTMTTSDFSVAMAISSPSAPGLRLQADNGQARERLAALHVLGGEFRLRAGKSNQLPAGKVLVAAIDRVGEHPFHRVRTHGVEEDLRRRPGEVACLALFERGDHLVLLRGREAPERRAVSLAAVRLQAG